MKHEFMMSRAYEWTSDDDFDATSQSLEVAMWVVVAGYGVMWLGAVWWWQRRKARVMKSLTEVEVVS